MTLKTLLIMVATLGFLPGVTAHAQPVQEQPPSGIEQQRPVPTEMAVPSAQASCDRPARVRKHRKHVTHAAKCSPARTVRKHQAAPALIQSERAQVHKTIIREIIEVQRVVVNRPTVVISAPPTIVRTPCCRPNMPVAQRTCGSSCPTGQAGGGPAVGGQQWKPTVDCAAMGGTRTVNPNTGKPSCLVP